MTSQYKERLKEVLKQVKSVDSISKVVRDNIDYIANGKVEEMPLFDKTVRPDYASQQRALFSADESKIESQQVNISRNDIELIKTIVSLEEK